MGAFADAICEGKRKVRYIEYLLHNVLVDEAAKVHGC
jgi:hypothetical protein